MEFLWFMPFLSDMAYLQKMAEKETMENNTDHDGMAEAPSVSFDYQTTEPQRWTLRVGKDGRLVIPAAARALMELGKDGQVSAILENGTLRILSPITAWRRIDEIMKPFRDPTRSFVDEFIAEKRAEQAREDAKD
jgi:bifunctional DNA-binding transcriptional regulator/antitoxin component of YhaV-PrlF toxin-antitoxin module